MLVTQKPAYSYLDDPEVPEFAGGEVFTVMDANCALCARGASWIAHNDKKHEFRIIPLQSTTGRALLAHYNLDPDDPATWLYIQNGVAFTSLDAFVEVANRLGGINRIFLVLKILPSPLRQYLYRLVATNRYRWFGRADLCDLPDAEIRKRLLG